MGCTRGKWGDSDQNQMKSGIHYVWMLLIFYGCIEADSSRHLILGTTEKLSENIIYKRKILTFSCADDKSSVLYRIQLRQTALNKESYDYFENLK